MVNRLRKRLGDHRDGGYSLTELLVSMIIFGIVMGITFGILITITNQSKDTLARIRALEEAKLGISQIDRQVRSGNVIMDPKYESDATAGVPKYYSMRIYTQAGAVPLCAQWRVKDKNGDGYGDLEFRTWKPGPLDVQEWSAVAHNLVKMDFSGTTPSADRPEDWPPFWVDNSETAATQAQFVRVTLRLRDPSEREGGKPTSVTTVITGRNTVFGYSQTLCASAPTP